MAHTAFELQYQRPSQVQHELDQIAIQFSPDGNRSPTLFQGQLAHPLPFREAMSTLYNIYASDLRYKAQDRTAYLQHLQRQAAKNPGDAKSAAQMKQAEAFILSRLEEEEAQDDVMDPLLTVHPDEAFIEVFSLDESTYARLAFQWEMFSEVKDLKYGTTHIDFSKDFYEALQRIRSYKPTQVGIDPEAFKGKSKGKGKGKDAEAPAPKELKVPDTWLRGLLQVQSAATLPMSHFRLDPIDLYNILIFLRMNKANKAPRGLRFELIPGASPRIVLEPWEQCFFSKGPAFEGQAAHIVRTWGRQRLQLLARLLPFTKTIDIYTLGSGLPTFYILDLGAMTFTMALSGWTNQNWNSSTQFAAMMPSADVPQKTIKQLDDVLQSSWSCSLEHIIEDLGISRKDALIALQHQCQAGKVMYDLANDVYRYRELSATPLDLDRLKHRNEREERGNVLVAQSVQSKDPFIKITKFNHILGTGTEIHGEVEDREAFRTHQCSFALDLDGRMSRIKCSSPWFQNTKGKEGPSEYVIALYLLYMRQQADEDERRRSGEDRQVILAETRSLTRRRGAQETLYQLTMDHKQVRVQWGPRGQTPRQQTLVFNQTEEARDEYFARIDHLTAKGFIEA